MRRTKPDERFALGTRPCGAKRKRRCTSPNETYNVTYCCKIMLQVHCKAFVSSNRLYLLHFSFSLFLSFFFHSISRLSRTDGSSLFSSLVSIVHFFFFFFFFFSSHGFDDLSIAEIKNAILDKSKVIVALCR